MNGVINGKNYNASALTAFGSRTAWKVSNGYKKATLLI